MTASSDASYALDYLPRIEHRWPNSLIMDSNAPPTQPAKAAMPRLGSTSGMKRRSVEALNPPRLPSLSEMAQGAIQWRCGFKMAICVTSILNVFSRYFRQPL